jgi:hypothetical protein
MAAVYRMRFTRVERGRRGEYRADVEVDGRTVARVERSWAMGGMRRNEYRAIAFGRIVASGRTLEDLKAELREWLADEYPDARESW